jgi:hypothetical protein
MQVFSSIKIGFLSLKDRVYTLTIFDLSSYQQEPFVDSVERRRDSAIQAGLAALTAPSLLAA